MLKLRGLELPEHVKPALYGTGGKDELVGRKQIRVNRHLVVLVGRGLSHGLGRGLVVHDHDLACLVQQKEIQNSHELELRGLAFLGVEPGGQGQLHFHDVLDPLGGLDDPFMEDLEHGLPQAQGLVPAGTALLVDDGGGGHFEVPAEVPLEDLDQGAAGLYLALGLEAPVGGFDGRVDRPAEGEVDAHPLGRTPLHVLEPVFEGAVEVGDDLAVADVQVLAEYVQGLASVHGMLLSASERKKGESPRAGAVPFGSFQTFGKFS